MRWTPDTHLHSQEHVLADDLSRMLLEPKRFASYLGIARMYYESDLRALAKRVLAKDDLDPRSRGRYFFASLKNLEKRPRRFWARQAARRRRNSKPRKPHHVKATRRNPAGAGTP